MAKDFDGKKVKASRTTTLKTVMNQDAHQAANKFYFALRLQLGEEKEYLKATLEKKYGKEVSASAAGKDSEVTLLFTESELADAMYRAYKNPEDIPKASLLLDILEEIGE